MNDHPLAPSQIRFLTEEETRNYANGLKKTGPSEQSLATQQVKFYRKMDERLRIEDAAGPGIACASGCSYCCHLRVEVTAVEALVIAAHLKSNGLDGDDMRERLQRNAATRATSLGMRNDAPCAFLGQDHQCSIYEVRPNTCRTHHSLSVEPCKASFDTNALLNQPQEHMARNVAGNVYILSSMDGQKSEQYDTTVYELSDAVLRALTQKKAYSRWKKKQKVFV